MTSEADAIAPARPARSGRSITIPQDDKSVASAVRKLAWPIILENLFQTALGTTNMVMVAQLGAAVAGIGTATRLLMILQAAFGASLPYHCPRGRAVGAGDSRMASRVAKQSVCLGALVSVFIAVAGNWGSHWAILALGTEPEVAVLGGAYLRVVTAAALVMVTMFVAGAALRGAGDTRTPMKVTGLINQRRIYVLIFGPRLPALGVGLRLRATVARTVGPPSPAVLIRGRAR